MAQASVFKNSRGTGDTGTGCGFFYNCYWWLFRFYCKPDWIPLGVAGFRPTFSLLEIPSSLRRCRSAFVTGRRVGRCHPHPYTVDRCEVLQMAHRWDKVGRPALCAASGPGAPDPDERCMAFVVPKPGTDPPETRQILDWRASNRKESSLRTGSKCFPHACIWLDLVIPLTMSAYFSSNDLRHTYHAFACRSRKRSRTMVIGQPYRLSEVLRVRELWSRSFLT